MKRITDKIKEHSHNPKTSGYACNDVNVANGINNFLKYHKADCLAMYIHHRGLFESLFKQCITKNVAVPASVPLLVIHEKDFPG